MCQEEVRCGGNECGQRDKELRQLGEGGGGGAGEGSGFSLGFSARRDMCLQHCESYSVTSRLYSNNTGRSQQAPGKFPELTTSSWLYSTKGVLRYSYFFMFPG